jgi:hypothetical protein
MIIRRNKEPVVHGHLLEHTTPWKKYKFYSTIGKSGIIIDDNNKEIFISYTCLKKFFKVYRR